MTKCPGEETATRRIGHAIGIRVAHHFRRHHHYCFREYGRGFRSGAPWVRVVRLGQARARAGQGEQQHNTGT